MKTVESVKEEEDFRREESSGEGGKFSGSASRETPEGIFLFHATLMFDVDLDRMTAVLNASPAKLARHRIASVRSRVTNLCDRYPDLKMETVMGAIISESIDILMDPK
jgi:lipoate-protein ligase A